MKDLVATYRLQLGPALDFDGARSHVDYLERLGVSHLYLSPILQARPGSTHGYDVLDPTRISEDLGGEARFLDLANAGLDVVADIVPNHMAADDDNPLWADSDIRPEVFDIDTRTGFRRRFFDIDDLVGVRVEQHEVFELTHAKIRELVAVGAIQGVRIDHIDGLAKPAQYLDRLANFGFEHIWVEKILQPGEALRDWPIDGTTGYDALNDLTALFIDPLAKEPLRELSGDGRSFAEIAHEAKSEQARTTFSPEVRELSNWCDATQVATGLTALPIYRTYVDPDNADTAGPAPTEQDRTALAFVPDAVAEAFFNPLRAPEFVIRFQQTSGAVMAKGVEDTALYRDVRLLALNEVGGNPDRFSITVEQFHAANIRRAERWPHALLASQTHDAKRSGDVRARLAALSHRCDDWIAAVRCWRELDAELRHDDVPDWNESLFIYQTLVGGWPITIDRLTGYLRKAFREAKRHTNWIAPDEKWEASLDEYCTCLLHHAEFVQALTPFVDQLSYFGEQIALGQLVLRCTMPGVPDIYQGDEAWNLAFVDPDNRRPVDWPRLEADLAGLNSTGVVDRANAKLFVTTSMLKLRQRRPEVFLSSYRPLASSSTTCAYMRGETVVVAVSLRDSPIAFEMPKGSWRNILEPLDLIYGPARFSVFENT